MKDYMHKTDCLFCKIVTGEIPCHEVWSNDTHLAFLSIFPNMEGVTVVIPKEHHGSYVFDAKPSVITELMSAAQTVAKKLDAHFADVGRCGVVFEGFGVDHLHAKLYPLHGTSSTTEWQPMESGHINTYFDIYPGYIASNDSERADDEQLAVLARELREQK